MRWLTCLCFPLCFLVFLAGCSGPDSAPSGVLSRDKMQQVLWDIIEADQYSALYLLKDSARINVKAETAGRYEQVFQLHKISRDQFNKSIRYYFSRPDIAKPLFDSLAAMGMRKRTEDYHQNTNTHVPGPAPNNVPPKNVPNHVPGPIPANTVLPKNAPLKNTPLKNVPPSHILPGNTPSHIPLNSVPSRKSPKKIPYPIHDSVPKQK